MNHFLTISKHIFLKKFFRLRWLVPGWAALRIHSTHWDTRIGLITTTFMVEIFVVKSERVGQWKRWDFIGTAIGQFFPQHWCGIYGWKWYEIIGRSYAHPSAECNFFYENEWKVFLMSKMSLWILIKGEEKFVIQYKAYICSYFRARFFSLY